FAVSETQKLPSGAAAMPRGERILPTAVPLAIGRTPCHAPVVAFSARILLFRVSATSRRGVTPLGSHPTGNGRSNSPRPAPKPPVVHSGVIDVAVTANAWTLSS